LCFFIYFIITHPKKDNSEQKNVPIAKESELSPSPTQDGSPSPEETSVSPSPTVNLSPGEINVLSSKEASDVWTSKENNIIKYFCKAEGNVYQVDIKTKTEETSSSFTPNLIKILWSPNGYHMINIFKQGDMGLSKYSYNLITKENLKLGTNLKYITWSPNGEKIAYHYYNPSTEEGFVSISDPDGKNWENLTPTSSKDLKIDWPKNDKISFFNLTPSNETISDLSIINPETGESPKSILQRKYGLGVLWSPSGTKLLFSGADNSGDPPKLYVLDEALEQKTLNVEGIAEKCVWSKMEKFIYCAVLNEDLPEINLPQDWYSTKFIGQDQFLQIDITTGEKKLLSEEENYDATNLSLSPNEDYLYFVNKESKFLYELKL
jgi:hypothetical protein